ncbi:WD40 repeat domain-containing protein, partial [bacterium]|nr:WD40 repeat domain-containing protein [bacterium]
NENPRADFWKAGEPASKKTARLASLGQSVAIATDAKTVAVGLEDGRVVYLATADLTPLREATKVGQSTVGALAYHPRGRYLACATYDSMGADNLVVVDPLTGETPLRFAADPSGITAVCFNADGSRMATFSGAGRVAIWDTSALAAN